MNNIVGIADHNNFAIQSSFYNNAILPNHVAVIMDGNGRWAIKRRLPRYKGHRSGADSVHRIVELSKRSSIKNLSLYAFSSDNWSRPSQEVNSLMSLFATYLKQEQSKLMQAGIRLTVIGRRDRLKTKLISRIKQCESATQMATQMHLRIAIDYSARFETKTNANNNIPDVDLLIRTGGEKRLSDFLLLQSAYAELLFIDRLWPDFSTEDWNDALQIYGVRQRRFGRIAIEQSQ